MIHVKRTHSLAAVFALTLSMLMLAACGRSSIGLPGNTEKRMTITAENADRDTSFAAGSLEVKDGEQIVISSDLTKGSIRVVLVGTPEEQSIDETPELDGEATRTCNIAHHGNYQNTGGKHYAEHRKKDQRNRVDRHSDRAAGH